MRKHACCAVTFNCLHPCATQAKIVQEETATADLKKKEDAKKVLEREAEHKQTNEKTKVEKEDKRLAQLGTRQVVNLNDRAPKRPVSHVPQHATDIAGAGRPLPLAKFLDEKEREDTSWKTLEEASLQLSEC